MKRNRFGLSHTNLLSCDMGELVPIGFQEVLPGDTFQMSTSLLVRTAPLLAPVMHPVPVMIHHWFVPFRLLWDQWESFITGGPDGDSLPVFPTIAAPSPDGWEIGSLADYCGHPVGVSGFVASAMKMRAYAKIVNENYRDQDLIDPLPLSIASGADTTTSTSLFNAAWEKDYLTTTRPWTQKGPEVSIPLTGDAPVRTPFDAGFGSGALMKADAGTDPQVYANGSTLPASGLYADLSDVTSATVNDLRLALALQRYEENRARYGSRYTEYLQYLGVKSSDARLQRPEYLGGGKQTIQFSEVLQTAEGTNPVGELRGHGIGAVRSNAFRRFFEEHGIIVSLMSVKPKTIYMNPSPRMDNRRTKEDFWQKELEHIGQQEVLNKEATGAHTTPDGVFGYQDRYDEYRRTESRVSGEFRTSLLDYWHYARALPNNVALNDDFVTCVPTKRTFPVESQDVLYVMANHNVTARRLVAKTGKSFIY